MTIRKAFLHNIAEGVELTDGINLSQLLGATEFWQNPVSDQVDFTTAEPVGPSVGDRYINTVTGVSNITATPVTANNIYEWDGAAWVETTVQTGYSTYDENLGSICSFNGTAWICATTPQYTVTYHVNSTLDTADDTNTGLYESVSFATLGAALDAGETGGVPFNVIIHDNAEYEVTESSGTPGIRDVGTTVRVIFPSATIKGQAGGVIWALDDCSFVGYRMNGSDLTMRPNSTGSPFTQRHWHLQHIEEPNWFWQQQSGAGTDTGMCQAWVDVIIDATNSHEGGIADFATSRKSVFRLTAQNVTINTSSASRTYDFKMNGSDSAMSVQIFNNDTKNVGAGDHVLCVADSGGRIYYRAECVGSSPAAAAECNGAGTDIYIHASDATDGGPLPYTGTNLPGIHDWSWQEGMNVSKIPANTGLDLADIINIRDVSAASGVGQQVQATLTDLQTILDVFYTNDGTLTGDRTVDLDGNILTLLQGLGGGSTANTGADDIVISSDGTNAGLSIVVPDGSNGNIYFAETGNNNKAGIVQYVGSVNELRLGVINDAYVRILSTLMRVENILEVRGQTDTPQFRVYSHTVSQGNPLISLYDTAGVNSFNIYTNTIRAAGTRDTRIQSVSGQDTLILRSTGATGTRFDDSGDVTFFYDVDVVGTIKGTSLETYNVVSKVFADSPYSTADGEVVLVDATGGNVTVNLPATINGMQVNIKKTDASANTVTVDGAGGDTIDGALTAVLTSQYESITVVSDGSDWFII